MSLGVHTVRVGIFNVDASGNRIDKDSSATSINQLRYSRQEALVIPDSSIANSNNYPNIKTYIDAEAMDGYQLLYMDASFIITGTPVSTTNGNQDVNVASFGNGLSDAFGRLRTSEPFTIFDSIFRYGDDPYKWNHTIVNNSGNAAVTYLSDQSSIALSVGTANGDSVIRETKRVFAYQAGKSFLILSTFAMAAPKAGLRQRVGYFGADDGVYLMSEGTSLFFVIRKSTSGTVNDTDEKVVQSSWNVDTLDGSGGSSNPSGILLDVESTQILFVDIEWLGVGTVRVGFVIDGVFICCHKFHHANAGLDRVYMKTALLPLRYEIANTSTTASNSTLKQICSTVISEGGYENRGKTWSASNALAGKSISDTTITPIISIRLKSTNIDSVVVPSSVEVLGLTNAAYKWYVIYGSTLTGSSFVSAGTNSNVEYDTTASSMTFTNGRVVTEGFFVGSAKGGSATIGESQVPFTLQLGRSLAGVSDIVTIAALATTNNDKAVASITWSEYV